MVAELGVTNMAGVHGNGGNTILSGQPPPLAEMSGPMSSSAPTKFINAGYPLVTRVIVQQI